MPQVALVVDDYDRAIDFFVDILGFELVEDSADVDSEGSPKRWVVVRPPGAETGLLLARARGPEQEAAVGSQAGGRVGFFLRVDDFDEVHARLLAAGMEVMGEPRTEDYGKVVVFRDIFGNLWDLLGSD
jgi:catechol 2,3-dioxygenase-like lactoylglutathione lyase family enzyme